VNPAPAVRPVSQEARGAGPRGKPTQGQNPNYVKVVNPVWNGKGLISRAKADRYILEGRGSYTSDSRDYFCLNVSHPRNAEAKERARIAEAETERGCQWPEGKVVSRRELLNIGVVCPAKAITENITKRSGSRRHVPGPSRSVVGGLGISRDRISDNRNFLA
jgi:hypothetical protein